MVVTGGLTWWKDFICVACYNVPDQRDEVNFSYSLTGVFVSVCVHFSTSSDPSVLLLLTRMLYLLVHSNA